MKVLQINCVYHYGSTGKITYDLHQHLLSQGVESLVFYGRGEKTKDKGVIKTCPELYGKANNLLSRVYGIMYGGCCWGTRRVIRMIKKEKPDIVHLQCLNGYFVNIYRLVSWLNARGIKTVLTLHAEFMYTANCAHALSCEKWRTGCGACPRLRQETRSLFFDGTAKSFQRMYAAFQGFEKNLTVVSVSPWLRQRAESSKILGNMSHRMILNGVDTGIFTYRPNSTRPKETIIFHATAMFSDDPHHLKGGWYLLELAKRLQDLSVRFLVAGKHSCSEAIPKNVKLLGDIRDPRQLADYYCAAEVTVLTSQRETFSMVCAESLCCGTPVVGFQAGGPEGICLSEFSEFVAPEDLDALEEAVRKWLSAPKNKKDISRLACRHYDRAAMLREYTDLYREMGHENPC